MSAFRFSRQAALAAILVSATPAAILAQAATAHSRPAVGIRVDVGPLLSNSGEPTAAWVAQEMPGALAAAVGGGPVSVRIDYVLLGPNSGGVGPFGASQDQMIGEVTEGGVTRPLRATTPYYPSAPDAAMIEQSNHDRVSALVQAFAGWVARGY